MTQLPEVEVLRKDLEREVIGKRIKDVQVMTASLVSRHRNRPDFYKALDGRKVSRVTRRSVYLLLGLDNDTVLVVKLGPQALLTRETVNQEATKNTQMVMTFTTGGALHLVDAAKSSELFVVDVDDLDDLAELSPGGIDPLSETFTWPALARELQNRQTGLKKLFVDCSFILGLGDLYADEILWGAGLAPTRVSNTLSSQEVRRLYRAIFEVVYEAVKQGGTSGEKGEHTDLFGEPGEYGDYLRVYEKEGEQCPRCRRPVTRSRIDTDLHSYHCSACQT